MIRGSFGAVLGSIGSMLGSLRLRHCALATLGRYCMDSQLDFDLNPLSFFSVILLYYVRFACVWCGGCDGSGTFCNMDRKAVPEILKRQTLSSAASPSGQTQLIEGRKGSTKFQKYACKYSKKGGLILRQRLAPKVNQIKVVNRSWFQSRLCVHAKQKINRSLPLLTTNSYPQEPISPLTRKPSSQQHTSLLPRATAPRITAPPLCKTLTKREPPLSSPPKSAKPEHHRDAGLNRARLRFPPRVSLCASLVPPPPCHRPCARHLRSAPLSEQHRRRAAGVLLWASQEFFLDLK
ncbi:hypothetical protein E2542_SST16694 [Spatholobus suberectus]|nr:hypothetical protein E2542_SST16694 [Spatholobus suberectus]